MNYLSDENVTTEMLLRTRRTSWIYDLAGRLTYRAHALEIRIYAINSTDAATQFHLCSHESLIGDTWLD